MTAQDSAIAVKATGECQLSVPQKQEVKSLLRSCFRLHEDLSAFYAEARKHKAFRWVPRIGAGRLLRAPTVFEDVVKMICTTNCSWSLTEIMVENLTTKLGRMFGKAWSFPTPEAIAGVSEQFMRNEIRSGYRSPYLRELAERVASGKLDLEAWRTSTLPTEQLFHEVRSIKGIGDYAAGNIMKLLGRYDYLGLDSWVRAQYAKRYKNGRRVSDRTIERHYAPFGSWRGLFFWLDMTKNWYDHQFPF
jgi:N-glycosylase/DNA lyase